MLWVVVIMEGMEVCLRRIFEMDLADNMVL